MNEQHLGRALGILAFTFGIAACGGIAISKADGNGGASSIVGVGDTSAGASAHGPAGVSGTNAGGAMGAGDFGGASGVGRGGEGGSNTGSAGLGGTASAGVGGSAGDGSGMSSGGAGASGAGGNNAACGDGVIENGEGCDDGNKRPGDGCSDSCAVDSGWTCSGTPSMCKATHPSCAGLAASCGPNGNADCCASGLVKGGTFDRGYDGATYGDNGYPATVSDFRLDTYEITVGRLRKFVAAYSQAMIAQGAGKNPNNPSDTGWAAGWNASLEANASALTGALKCDSVHQTWADAPGSAANESLPIDCIDWYEAEAFCIWDGGRLPTEAEWNYAAAGGMQQRAYPWGSTTPDCTYANFFGAAGGNDFCVAPGTGKVNRVGSESPKGDGLYGQADLAGNVWEWVQDTSGPYPNPCNDCSADATPDNRESGGGSFNNGAFFLDPAFQGATNSASSHITSWGARCARSAQ